MYRKNYFRVRCLWPFWSKFLFIDTEEYLADQIFIQHKLTVHFGDEYVKEGSGYRMILCRISRKREEDFVRCMDDLEKKILLCGKTDYLEFCEWMNLVLDVEDEAKREERKGQYQLPPSN